MVDITDAPTLMAFDHCRFSQTAGESPQATLQLAAGDACHLHVHHLDDALWCLRAIATLIVPISGRVVFKGEAVDYRDYRNLLPVKRRIGYIGPDAAMISNISVRDNLLYARMYAENNLTPEMDEFMIRWCREFQIYDKLDQRPAALNEQEQHFAIAIRELAKQPDILVLFNPEDTIGHAQLMFFLAHVRQMRDNATAIVFSSSSRRFVEPLTNRCLTITDRRWAPLPMRCTNADGGVKQGEKNGV